MADSNVAVQVNLTRVDRIQCGGVRGSDGESELGMRHKRKKTAITSISMENEQTFVCPRLLCFSIEYSQFDGNV